MIVKRGSQAVRAGTTVVEVALVLLVCLIFMFAIYEYGRFLMMRQLVENAAREGARQAVTGTNTVSTAQIQNTVLQYLANQPLQNASGSALQASDIQVFQANPATGHPATPDSTWNDAAFGSPIAVQVNAYYAPMLPTWGYLRTAAPVSATAMMLSEAN